MEIYTVENVNFSDIIKNRSLYQDALIKHKVLGFRNLNPTKEEHKLLLEKLYVGSEINPYIEDLILVNHDYLDFPIDKNDEAFILYNWHVDFPDDNKLMCSYITMHMQTFKCPPDAGQTIFINLIDLYERCPEKYKKQLNKKNIEFIGLRGLDPNKNIETHKNIESRTFRALRTHPITKETILFWTCGFWSGTSNPLSKVDKNIAPALKLKGSQEDWFYDFSDWILKEFQNKNNWGIWNWNENDFIIWDNRALLHSFSGGWNKEERIFLRTNIGDEIVYFDE